MTVNGEIIDDLLIEASAIEIDGKNGILGRAGPTALRSGSFLPAKGMMEYDIADLADMEDHGSLEYVVLHEMGHVLGIGSMWNFLGLVNGLEGDDPHYHGAHGIEAYREMIPSNPSSIPVANTGGQGTFGAHWRESTFQNELMTGYLNSGHNPLSTITIAALQDIGYSTDADRADYYFPNASIRKGDAPALSHECGDVIPLPIDSIEIVEVD